MPMPERALALALLIAAFAVNAGHNHLVGRSPAGPPMLYPAVFFVGIGTILPALLLGLTVRRDPRSARGLGLVPGRRDLFASLAALLVGGAVAASPLLPIVANPGGAMRVLELFCQLLVASVAEVALFLGVLAVALRPRRGGHPTWRHGMLLVVVSSVAFGLFHFTYPAPWNTPAMAVTVGVVWMLVSTGFALGRSLVAAVLLDNIMATVGFATRGLTLPLPAETSLGLAAIAAIAFVVAFRLARGASASAPCQETPG